MKRSLEILSILIGFTFHLFAQEKDTLKDHWLSIHAQATVINQFKPGFSAPYSGENSLSTQKESQSSMTSTLYLGVRLWKGSSVYFNPEIAGGSGLSGALGIGDATNGETFRVGSPAPQIYLARLFFRQIIPLRKEKVYQESDQNQLAMFVPTNYLSITIGKVGIADFFDDNIYSHDPRTQFMAWSLMDNGAWDYPANTRGYTPSVAVEFIAPNHELRYAFSLLPADANGNTMDWNVQRSGSHNLEYVHKHQFNKRKGAIRLLAFFNTTHMGNYKQSLDNSFGDSIPPDITSNRMYGRSKYGFGINMEQEFNAEIGGFFRASWNDGKNETWAFTEIDRSVSAGIVWEGQRWKRPDDRIGLAYVTSGLSKPHRDYLKAGGKGFILGDGNLDYGWEHLTELYYSAALVKDHLFLSGTYQFLLNPGYNKDRKGPVHILSIRLHMAI
jgi:high affinity Mn2+ porin